MKETLKLVKSLSDEIRLRIINLLFYKELYVCEIVEILELPQSTVSRHLAIMKNADIIEDAKDGLWVKYSLIRNTSSISIIKDIIQNDLINDEKCCKDIEKLKERMKHTRGCKIKC